MTGMSLYRACRKEGIALAIDGDDITFAAPAGVAVPLDDIRWCKAELMFLLEGNYLGAALALVLDAPPEQWQPLAAVFDARAGVDERAGICQQVGNMDRGEAERRAYIELAKAMEGGAR